MLCGEEIALVFGGKRVNWWLAVIRVKGWIVEKSNLCSVAKRVHWWLVGKRVN